MLEDTKKHINTLTVAYIFALSMIAVLSMSAHMILEKVISVQSSSATVINISGRQRMLSQRIAMLSYHYSINQSNDNKEWLSKAISLMQTSHMALTKGDEELGLSSIIPPEIMQTYYGQEYNLDYEVKEYIRIANQLLNEPHNKDLFSQVMDKAHHSLLLGLDKVVKQYELQSIEQVSMITFTQRIILMIIIATLMIEGLYIFRPIIKKIKYFAMLLYELATHDHLTQFANRRFTLDLLERLLDREKIDNKPLSIMMIDIDFFKKVNDTYGHNAGDAVLVAVSKLILKNVRPTDSCGRWGGEEFIVILPDGKLEDADMVAQRILLAIQNEVILVDEFKITTTVSIGLTIYNNPESITEFIARADLALYTAKNSGRNKIESK